VDVTGNCVCIGFADGIVRVLQISYDPFGGASLKRRHVFKPHNAAVVDICFSHSGRYICTAGKDGIIFLLKTAPLSESAQRSQAASTWQPMKFVTVASPMLAHTHAQSQQQILAGKGPIYCESVCWQAADDYILISCSDNVTRQISVSGLEESVQTSTDEFEAFFPIEEFVSNIAVAQSALGASASTASLSNSDAGAPPGSPLKSEMQDSGSQGNEDGGSSVGGSATQTTSVSLVPLKMGLSVYASGPARDAQDVFAAGILTLGGNPRNLLVESSVGAILPAKEAFMGLYGDGRELSRCPSITYLKNSESKKYLCIGTSEGSIVLKPNDYNDVFVRTIAHGGTTSLGGVTCVRTSYDDSYVISAGSDGSLAVFRLHSEIVEIVAPELSKDIDAGIFGNSQVKPLPRSSNEGQGEDSEPSYMTHVEVMDFCEDLDEHELLNEIADNLMAAIGGPSAAMALGGGGVRALGTSETPDVAIADEGILSVDRQSPQPVQAPSPSPLAAPTLAQAAANAAALAAKSTRPASSAEAFDDASVLQSSSHPTDEAADVPPNAYSIQEAKLKLEEDARKVAAEVLKSKVRDQVRALQSDFEALRERNNALPECVRLPTRYGEPICVVQL
jgi:WD40 repeat protein